MANGQQQSSSTEMTFFEHIDALRPHLIRGVSSILVIAIVAFFFRGFIIDTVLFGPQSPDFPTNRLLRWIAEHINDLYGWINSWAGTSLAFDVESLNAQTQSFNTINTYMAGQFNLHMKISFIVGLSLAIPYIVWELWRFVKPALTENEIRGTRWLVFWVSVCFFAGLAFGYFIMAPLSVNFFINYQASEHITNMIDVGDYFSTILIASLGCALMFQLPLLVYFLTRIGLISSTFLKKYRRHALVILMTIAAIITPPDIFSLFLVTIPLYFLYELSISLSMRVERKIAAEQQENVPATVE